MITPQPQWREMILCSVTSARISSGRSITCRRPAPVTSAPNRPVPQPEHRPGSWVTTASG
ncbi:MAG: hypothetical protein ACYCO9_19155 [Streptosporangiaceae bacterium]